jgi:seryl-tRNA synthetase
MIDIEKIRQHPEQFRRAIKTKKIPLDLDSLTAADQKRLVLLGEVNRLRELRNKVSETIANKPAEKAILIAQARKDGEELAVKENELEKINAEFAQLMAFVPSLPLEDVPLGETDKDNIEIHRWGVVPEKTFKLRDHIEIATMHKWLELEGARLAAGSRAYALLGDGALLELAILRLALDMNLAKGFTPVLPPLLVNTKAMFGTGYFPLGEDNAYKLNDKNAFLTGTSEVGMVSMHMDKIFNLEDLPLRLVGTSTCFRREAGAAGRDTRGLYRVHQFQKVEQVVFCINDPDIAKQEHLALLNNAENILKALELPYRVVAVCTGDMGLGQVQKHDIETWMPSRNGYGETHSCSTFFDFQARRLNLKYRNERRQKNFVYTLNNTAIASPRILIPFLENHQEEDGTVYIPAALRPYLGRDKIGNFGKKF